MNTTDNNNNDTTGPVYKGKKHKFVLNPTHKQRLGNYDEQKPLPPNTFVAYPEHFEYARKKAREGSQTHQENKPLMTSGTLAANALKDLFQREQEEDMESEDSDLYRVPNTTSDNVEEL